MPLALGRNWLPYRIPLLRAGRRPDLSLVRLWRPLANLVHTMRPAELFAFHTDLCRRVAQITEIEADLADEVLKEGKKAVEAA